MKGDFYPYTRHDIAAFFRSHAAIRFVYVKAERSMDDFGHYLCELIVQAAGERMFLQGIEFRGNRFHYPSHLKELPTRTRTLIEREILAHLLRTRVAESPLGDAELTYTGERIVPATAPFHAYWIHARRYEFASRYCRGKRVLDAGCGTGYGTRILSFDAQECLGVDIDSEAVSLGCSLFRSPNVAFVPGDITRLEGIGDASFDIVVALEVLEHLPGDSIPGFFGTALRVLRSRGTLIVSVANRIHAAKESNPYHLSEMTFEEFRILLERWFDPSGIQYFGQHVWGGSYRLDRECTIEPLRSAGEHHVYLATATRTEGS